MPGPDLNLRGALRSCPTWDGLEKAHHDENQAVWFASLRPYNLDLRGDYAGEDLFVVDLDSLLLHVTQGALTALSAANHGAAVLSVVHDCEQFLAELLKRACRFHVIAIEAHRVFWRDNPLLLIVRDLLIRHLDASCGLTVRRFVGFWDVAWMEYVREDVPLFVMLASGTEGRRESQEDVEVKAAGVQYLAARVLLRSFMLHSLTHGLSVALLPSLQFEDSRITAFVLFHGESGAAANANDVALCKSLVQNVAPKATRPSLVPRFRAAILDASLTTADFGSRFVLYALASQESLSRCLNVPDQQWAARLTSSLLLHETLLSTLPLSTRAQQYKVLDTALADRARNFLTHLIEIIEELGLVEVVHEASSDLPSDAVDLFDGTLFVWCAQFQAQNEGWAAAFDQEFLDVYSAKVRVVNALIGDAVTVTVPNGNLQLPDAAEFVHEVVAASLFPNEPIREPRVKPVLSFSHPDLDNVLQGHTLEDPVQRSDPVVPVDQQAYVTAIPFDEERHFHHAHLIEDGKRRANPAAALTGFALKRFQRAEARYAVFLRNFGESLSGVTASLKPTILTVGSGLLELGTDGYPVLSNGRPSWQVQSGETKETAKALAIKAAREAEKAKSQAEKELNVLRITLQNVARTHSVDAKIALLQADIAATAPSATAALTLLHFESVRLHHERFEAEWTRAKTEIADPATAPLVRAAAAHFLFRAMQFCDVVNGAPVSSQARAFVTGSLEAMGLDDCAAYARERLPKKSRDDPAPSAAAAPAPQPPAKQKKIKPGAGGGKAQKAAMVAAAEQAAQAVRPASSSDLAKSVGYSFPRRATFPPTPLGVSSVALQLENLQEIIPRNTNVVNDPRVPFKIDPWQKRVLDLVDERASVVVSVPTSGGKTLISFYAMEQVLREDDEGMLVFVCPTKALCNQILITVPDMLEILLVNPVGNSYIVPKLKRVVFDEVHTIGQEDVGVIWERLFLLVRCPILALRFV
ncbi:hypothetical protein BDK51DRAFT_38124 [Blyttiomyces helicus]|uniref:Uncharacterized protein n=1 Tax=Blyttiomyces helicus TaxID=388810 RepID=A0A4P9W9H2_9FUNG|nr:hypothetical protein BDK51DRAFT_38124 [Blyttiomyces helicus]|eukprot:RKO88822.1 hypothetical protein BDK51DRAFT_38124 [Blyttiomyces helicus]